MSTPTTEAAIDASGQIPAYVNAGLAVFPLHSIRNGGCTCGHPQCDSPGKHPLLGLAHRWNDPLRKTCHGECGQLGHGLYDATLDIGLVAEWLARWEWCNWAVRPPEGVIVLDVDPRNGGDRELLALTREHGRLPETLTARTGSGGLHVWLSYSGSKARGKLCTGVDVKTHLGYLVAPPSAHVSGGTYEWLNELPAAWAPRWVKRILNPPSRRIPPEPRKREGSIDGLVKFVADAPEGERNTRLFWAACRAHENGLDPAALIAAAESVGLSTMAAAATVRSAANGTARCGKVTS